MSGDFIDILLTNQNNENVKQQESLAQEDSGLNPNNGEKSFSALCLNSALWKFFWGFLIMSLNLSGVPAVFAVQGAVAAGLIIAALWQMMPCGKEFRAGFWVYLASTFFGAANYFILGNARFSSDSVVIYINMLNTVLFTVVLLLLSIGCTRLFRVKKTEGKLAIRWSWLLYLTVFTVALYLGGGQDVSGIMGYIGLAAFVIILIQINSSRKKLFAAGVDCKARTVRKAARWCVSVLAVLLFSAPFLSAVVYHTREAPASVYEPYDVSNQQEALEKDREIRENLVELGAFDKLVADLPQSLVENLEETAEVEEKVDLVYFLKNDGNVNFTENTKEDFDSLACNITLFKQDLTTYCVLYMKYVDYEAIDKACMQATGSTLAQSYFSKPDKEKGALFFSMPTKPSQQYRDVITVSTRDYTLLPTENQPYTLYEKDGVTWRVEMEEEGSMQNGLHFDRVVKLDSQGENQRMILCMEVACGTEDTPFTLTMHYTHWELPLDTPYHHLFNDPGKMNLYHRNVQWVMFNDLYTERERENLNE